MNQMKYNGAIIISAFPACGKSYMVKNFDNNPYRMCDSDSSKFSWIYDDAGNKTDVRNPNFIEDYISHITKMSRMNDVVFVSSHETVREALISAGIPFVLVFPSHDMKDVMIQRMIDRGNDQKFVDFQREHFDEFVTQVEDTIFPRIDNILVSLYMLDEDHPFISNEMIEYLMNAYDG